MNPVNQDRREPEEPAEPPEARRASFGYRDVDPGEKPGLVRGVFSSVASRYDLMNDLMSAGVHRLWKATLIDMLAPTAEMHLVDVAGGTGDIAQRFRDAGGGRATVCDLTEAMVATGRDRSIDAGRIAGFDWLVGDAEALPFPDGCFDAYTIGFGLRNVADLDAALAEARRVLRPGGRFLCLEFSHVVLPALTRFYDAYSFAVLPRLGGLVAGDRDSYRYLVESIRRFPDQQALVERMRTAGLDRPAYRNLTGGIAAIHSAWRL